MQPPTRNQVLFIECVSLLAYLWYCWSVSQMVSNEDSKISQAHFFLGCARVCYKIAHWVGRRGIKLENSAYELVREVRL